MNINYIDSDQVNHKNCPTGLFFKFMVEITRTIQHPVLAVILFLSVFCCSLLSAEQLTLKRALEIAFAKSPTMRQAALNLEIGERNLKAQQATLKSQFNLILYPYQYFKERTFSDLVSQYNTLEQTSSAAQLSIVQPIKWTDGTLSIVESIDWREASSSFTGSVKETNYSNTLFLRFSQPLFTYNRTQIRLKELKLSLENAQLNFTIQKLQIESQVTQQFLDLFHKQKSIQIAGEEYDNATESYEIIESKVNAGISAKEELYQAELTQANSRASLENSQIQYENALDRFRILLGLPLELELEVVADIRKRLIAVDLKQAITHGLKHRMELRQSDIAIQNALFDLIRTGSENEFKASVDLTYGLTGTDKEFADIYKSPTRNQSVSLTLNIPLFDWGEKKHHLAASEAAVRSRELSYEEEEKQVVFEIRQVYRNLQNQKTQIEIAEKNVKNARLTYEINLERYKNGDLTSKDISFYQTQLSQEQLGEVAALINYQVALLDLKIRTLWDFEQNKPVVEQN